MNIDHTIIGFLCAAMVCISGCSGSRWARSDPDYAAKYPRHTDNIPRTIKQAVDARHLRDKGGVYAAVGYNDRPFGLGGEIGGFKYQNPYLETRLGFSGLAYEGDRPLSGGGLLGVRVQTPSRLAPFAGIGMYGGSTPPRDASNDGRDNDDNGFIDEQGETDNDFVVALAPEVGCHYWLTPAWRLTGSASYLVTSSGRDDDFLMLHVSLAHLSDLGKRTSSRAISKRTEELGWKVGDGPGLTSNASSPPAIDSDSPTAAVLPPPTQHLDPAVSRTCVAGGSREL